jgi:hypothetical protein
MTLPRLKEDDLIKGSKSTNQQAVRFSNKNYLSALKNPNTPQAVIKVLKTARHNKVKDLLNYIARQNDKDKENVELETSDGNVLQDKKEIKELYNSWKADFERKKKKSKTAPRHATHMIFSADCQQKRKNILKLQDCVRDLATRNFNGYEYAFGIHQDGKKPHVHLVVKCKSREKGVQKLRINPDTLFQLRQEFAEGLTRRGLNHCSTLFKDRPSTIKDRLFPKAPQKTWFQVKLKDIQQEASLLKKQYNKIEISLKTATDSKKKSIYKKRDVIGERVNQLKRNISERTTPNTVQRSQSFNIVRKLERELKRRDPTFKNIIKRADQLNPIEVQGIKLKKFKHASPELQEFVVLMAKDFSETRANYTNSRYDENSYEHYIHYQKERTALALDINQLKEKINSFAPSKEKKDSVGLIKEFEKKLKEIDPVFDKLKATKETIKTNQTPPQLNSALKNLEQSFSKIEKANLSFKIDQSVYKDEITFIGEQVNQLKINVKLNTKKGSKERRDSFNTIRKFERDLKKRDPRFKKIIKMSGHLKTTVTDKKEVKNISVKIENTTRKLEAKILQMQTQEKYKNTNSPYFINEKKLTGEQIGQLKKNINLNTEIGSRERIGSVKAIKKLEQNLKQRDFNLQNTNKKTKQLNEKKFVTSKVKAEQMAFSLIEAKNIIKRMPDAKERKEAKKLLSEYTKVVTKSSPEIKKSYKNIKKKERRIGF